MKLLLPLKNSYSQSKAAKPLLSIICGFLFLSLFARGIGGTNEMSRYATMHALSNDLSFEITEYKGWTLDWSQVGERYFSNKAPGPALLGFPVYFATQFLFDSKGPPKSSQRVVVALLAKLLPMCLILFFGFSYLIKSGTLSEIQCYLLLILVLYACTPSLFYNTFFGHGTASLFMLLTFIALYLEKNILCGFAFGLSLLSEYSAALFLLPLVIMMSPRRLIYFALGGIVPGVAWIIFHMNSTGSPFVAITSFMNPIFLSADPKYFNGMLGYPDISVIGLLLYGSERGLLFSQPWVLFSLGHVGTLCFKKDISFQKRKIFIATIVSSVLLILLNASFNNWHGGATSGPRYLSLFILPLAFSQALALPYIRSTLGRKLLFILIFTSVLIRSFIYSTTPLAYEGQDLFRALADFFIQHGGAKSILRFSIFWLTLGGASYVILIKEKES